VDPPKYVMEMAEAARPRLDPTMSTIPPPVVGSVWVTVDTPAAEGDGGGYGAREKQQEVRVTEAGSKTGKRKHV
jgi:hypothetical protein